jgi:RNA polymerase sigma factor (sigma-70 family)
MSPRENESELVARAIDGESAALEAVVNLVQDPIYRLALRMVLRPPDAEDATQEILVRVVTRLSSWQGEASLVTWAYRIGVNYLLNLRRTTPLEQMSFTFDRFSEDLANGTSPADYAGPDAELLAEEVRLSCTQAVLQCLERSERITYLLGEVFDLPSDQAAWILDTTPAAYRKRLERARRRIRAAMSAKCGLVNEAAACRCSRRIEVQIARGRLDRGHPVFATHPTSGAVREAERQMQELHDTAALLSSHPAYSAPRSRSEAVLTLARSGRFSLLATEPPAEVDPDAAGGCILQQPTTSAVVLQSSSTSPSTSSARMT